MNLLLSKADVGLKEPKLNGNLTLKDTEFTVKYLNTHYPTNHPCRHNELPGDRRPSL